MNMPRVRESPLPTLPSSEEDKAVGLHIPVAAVRSGNWSPTTRLYRVEASTGRLCEPVAVRHLHGLIAPGAFVVCWTVRDQQHSEFDLLTASSARERGRSGIRSSTVRPPWLQSATVECRQAKTKRSCRCMKTFDSTELE